ncbi:hypothetical protein WJX72_003182 [[Myrmecia] bisecta]|uniref:PCI domain-containing protein n=1 Tax=[Myrmecia] bisecta TaxID=41462 RepID=A0AAW1QF51_9CHLO
MGKEIDMKDADAPAKPDDQRKPEDGEEERQKPTLAAQLKANVALIDKAVRSKDTRLLTGRLLRQTALLRKQLTPDALTAFVKQALPAGLPAQALLLDHLRKAEQEMDTDGAIKPAATDATLTSSTLPEVEVYAYLLAIVHLVDHQMFPEAKAVSSAAVKRLSEFNRRTLDGLGARIYFYFSWAHESTNTLGEIRSTLLALHRTAVLRHDEFGQETLLNLLLRNYLHFNLYDQAEKLRSKAQRPEVSRSPQQLCRYLYYLGRIRAIQLDYTEAKDCLQQAARKAPMIAHGFRVTVNKWLALVRLLLGEIPEHSEFQQQGLQEALAPYFELTQAVRCGDLNTFTQVAEKYEAVFEADKTHNLIVRLRHNVIRAGLRRINLAYSRISLADVAKKLGLATVEDTECIVAKAIRDGGVDAVIDHANGWMSSKEVVDIYVTDEPQAAFHARVAFCLDIHNEAVKAMRFDPEAHKKRLLTAEAQRERLKQEEELALAMEEEDDTPEGF